MSSPLTVIRDYNGHDNFDRFQMGRPQKVYFDDKTYTFIILSCKIYSFWKLFLNLLGLLMFDNLLVLGLCMEG